MAVDRRLNRTRSRASVFPLAGRCHRCVAAILTSLVVGVGTATAGTGLLQGRVRAGDIPIEGATIAVPGTSLTAVTDAAGRFALPIVPAGLHRVRVQASGYEERLIEDLAVWPDLTTEVSLALVPDTESPDAAKPPAAIVHSHGPGVTRQLPERDLRLLPAQGVLYAATQLPGVAGVRSQLLRGGNDDHAIAIRGGSRFETAWSIDGRSQPHPAVTAMPPEIPSAALGAVGVTTSGFGAEYGGVSSGIVHVLTRGPGAAYRASATGMADPGVGTWARRYDQKRYEVSLEGPLAPGSDRGGFLLAGSRRSSGDRLPRFVADHLIDGLPGSLGFDGGRQPENTLTGWSWLGRASWRPADPVRLELSARGSRDDWREFTQAYLFDPGHMPRHVDRAGGGEATLQVTRGSGTLVDFSVGYTLSDQRSGDGVLFDDLRGYSNPSGNPSFDPFMPYFWRPGHVRARYERYQSSTWRFAVGVVRQWHDVHQLKVGVQTERAAMRFYDGNPTTFFYDSSGVLMGGIYQGYGFDAFARGTSGDGLGPARHPTTISGYLQDRVAWRGAVRRGGLRLDSFDVDGRDLGPLPPPGGAPNVPAGRETRLSPRVDATWTGGRNLTLRAGAGEFHQPPPFFLDPLGQSIQRSRAVELGATHRPREGVMLDAALFARSLRDFVDAAPPPADPQSRQPNATSGVGDATFKGLELQATLDDGRGRVAWAGYALTSSRIEAPVTGSRNIAWTTPGVPLEERPLSTDQRHRLAAGARVATDRGGGPRMLGRTPLERANPRDLALSADERTLYVANTLGHTIAAISVDGDVNLLVGNLVVGGLATDVKIAGRWGIDPERDLAHAA